MPVFDPTKPAANSLISSSELRDQLNALHDQLSALTNTVTTLSNTVATMQGVLTPVSSTVNTWKQNLNGINQLSASYTDPVAASDLNEVANKVNEVIADLS